MKNFIIAVLIVLVGGLGVVVFTGQDSLETTSNTATNTSEMVKKTPSSGGKALDFSGKDLQQIDKNQLNDSSVTILDVSDNRLDGALPTEIRRLSNLEELYAQNNLMTGVPAEIGQLKKLKKANFANNQLTGLPLEIGNLSQLEVLDLRGNPNISQYDISQIKPKIPNAQILTD